MQKNNSKKKKKNNDLIFKILISVLLLANVIATGVNSKSISKLAENNKPVTPVTRVINDKPYNIKYGDTLSEIVNSQYGKYDYQLLMGLANYNNIKDVDKIYAGDTLLIPSAKTLTDKSVTVAKQNNTVTKSEPKSTVKTVATTKNNTVAKENVDTVKKEDVRTIKNDVDTLKKDVSVLQTEMTDVKSDIKSASEKTNENTKQIETLNTKVNDNTAKIESVNKKVDENTESVKLLETQTMINTNDVRYHTEEINRIEDYLDKLESDFTSSRSNIDTILKRLNEIENSIDAVNNNTLSKEDFLNSIPSDTEVKKEEIAKPEPQPFLEPNVYEEIKDKQEPDNTYFEYINTDDINTVSDENVEPLTPVETEVITVNPVETEITTNEGNNPIFTLPREQKEIPEFDTSDLYGEQIFAKANMKTR